ncbi:hypothetical protein BDQ12DRAFT_729525 [Crucibulum laeve]|uniref:Large ribosomal subunit protein bL28m n=1 Tax=Crucibulum laeve TaxID=68775 RepID=A0A5C3LHU0_9AGAR|nr:hypothetical protein BDQ12DRAFT_729525 [Crucibulum laeve]
MFPTVPWLEAVSQPFKRAQLGLFHGKMKQYGNNVPFSKKKTRRTWLPNVQRKRLESEALGEQRLHITTRALKSIKKHGGLDNYVKNTRADLLGWEGMRLRMAIKDVEHERAEVTRRFEEEERKNAEPTAEELQKQKSLETGRLRKLARTLGSLELGLALARKQREEAGKSLGLDRLATANETREYIEKTGLSSL